MSNVIVNWSGEYPCLCSGEWSLIIDGVNFSHLIPENLRNEEMRTLNTYSHWKFNDDFLEEWEYYPDGLPCYEWIEANKYWLDQITEDTEILIAIYEAINEKDWRHGQCGGCI